MNRRNQIARPAFATVALAVASLTHAQVKPAQQPSTPPNSIQGGVNRTPWFANQQTRTQLKFNDNQLNGLNQAYQKAWDTYQKGVSSIPANLNAAQRQERLRELQQEFYQGFASAPDTYLKDPEQRRRFDQLHWQYRGYGAFSDPFVSDRMKLTPAQREKLQSYQQNWYNDMNKLATVYQKNPEAAVGQFNKIEAQNGAQINSVLTPAQQQTWQQMTGTPYTFSPGAYLSPNTQTPGTSGKK